MQEFLQDDSRPHVALFLRMLGPLATPGYIAPDTDARVGQDISFDIASALSLEPSAMDNQFKKLQKAMREVIPQTTAPGSSHTYMHFAMTPPAKTKGTIHVTQIAGHAEPPLGSNWDTVMMMVGDLLNGMAIPAIQVSSPPDRTG